MLLQARQHALPGRVQLGIKQFLFRLPGHLVDVLPQLTVLGGEVRGLLGQWRRDGNAQIRQWQDWVVVRVPA